MEKHFSDVANLPVPGQLPVYGFKCETLEGQNAIPAYPEMEFAAATKLLHGRVRFYTWGGHIIDCHFKEFEQRYKPYPLPSSDLDIPDYTPNTCWTLHRERSNVASFLMEDAVRHLMNITGKERLLIISTFQQCFNSVMRSAYDTAFAREGGRPSSRRRSIRISAFTATSSV